MAINSKFGIKLLTYTCCILVVIDRTELDIVVVALQPSADGYSDASHSLDHDLISFFQGLGGGSELHKGFGEASSYTV